MATATSLTARLRARFTRRSSLTPSNASSADGDTTSRPRSIAQSIRSLRSRGNTTRPASIAEAVELPTNVPVLKEEEGESDVRMADNDDNNKSHEGHEQISTDVQMTDADVDVDDVGCRSVGGSNSAPEESSVSELNHGPKASCDLQVQAPRQELEAKAIQAKDAGSSIATTTIPHSTDSIIAPTTNIDASSSKHLEVLNNHAQHSSSSTADYPTPNSDIGGVAVGEDIGADLASPIIAASSRSAVPTLERRQSLLPSQQTRLIKTLLETDIPPPSRAGAGDYFQRNGPSTISANMVHRKIWVKRPQASATLVQINEDDLVDDVRDMILKKYANSLGRNFDAPDVTLRICPREHRQERVLGPEEPISRTIDAYFPGGQTVEEALVIDVPMKRTPRPSPRGQPIYYTDEMRPVEAGTDYFPPMPIPAQQSPHVATAIPVNGAHHSGLTAHAMSVLTTGHVPPLPSPGSARRGYQRPRPVRNHTSSPTVISQTTNGTHLNLPRTTRSRTHSSASERSVVAPVPPPLPTPPASQEIQRVSTPPPRVSSPRPGKAKKSKKNNDHPNLPAGLLNGGVPPINVLIVEDNIINLRLLEAFMKRLKVRWQTAMNGKEAVTKWRAGGFHLVLMDIQLPVMNGLDATREIRRLEKLNSIGVFSSSASSKAPEQKVEPEGEDKLPSSVLFKSPVIIVALTASSLQSDRHEALAAGCNDFLTKPVNFVWLERKVMEWGCMQALIDFDGWRKWKDFSEKNDTNDTTSGSGGDKKSSGLMKKKKNRNSLGGAESGRNSVARINEEGETA